jgi:hypothetical protein
VINERRLAYEGAVERFAKDKALGKIGAVAEQEATKKPRTKGRKVAKLAATAPRSKADPRRTQMRMKSITGEVPTTTVDNASAAPPAP